MKWENSACYCSILVSSRLIYLYSPNNYQHRFAMLLACCSRVQHCSLLDHLRGLHLRHIYQCQNLVCLFCLIQRNMIDLLMCSVNTHPKLTLLMRSFGTRQHVYQSTLCPGFGLWQRSQTYVQLLSWRFSLCLCLIIEVDFEGWMWSNKDFFTVQKLIVCSASCLIERKLTQVIEY